MTHTSSMVKDIVYKVNRSKNIDYLPIIGKHFGKQAGKDAELADRENVKID